jgi:amidase
MPLPRAHLGQLPRLRIATYVDNGVGKVTPETVKTVTDAAETLASAGMRVTEAPLPEAELTYQLFNAAFSADGGATLRRVLEKAGTTELSPFLEWLKSARQAPSAALTDLVEQVDRLRSRLVGYMWNYDILVCPVATRPAIPHGIDPRSDGGTTYMVPFNLLGWPVVVVRCGSSPEGLPIGVQVVGRPWTEDVVLAVAKHLEREFGGWQPTRL